MTLHITYDQFKSVFPRAKYAKTLYDKLEILLPKYDITTPERVGMFLAQVGHESGGFSIKKENMNYSATRLNQVFYKYFGGAGRNPAMYSHKPEEIANVVYANRLGNGSTASGDGYKFIGRGFIQLTGRSNYEAFAKSIGKSLDSTIKYLETTEGALVSALWFWTRANLNSLADKQDILNVTKRINGGTNGYDDRLQYWNKLKSIMGKSIPPETNNKVVVAFTRNLGIGDRGLDVKAVQQQLGISADGVFGPNTHRNVKQFQLVNRLTPDGVVGPHTWKALFG